MIKNRFLLSNPSIASAAVLLGFLFLFQCDSCDKNPGSSEPETVTDIDGNEYQIIKIGNQLWMAENLKVTRYRNGDPIPGVTDDAEWNALTTGASCEYQNTASNSTTYGRLYNWYAVNDSRNIAPEGWHVPSHEEWETLGEYLGGLETAGGKMKETGTSHWNSPNTDATNESGFTALAGGFRSYNGGFTNLGKFASFWSSTEYNAARAWNRSLYYGTSNLDVDQLEKQWGLSIRCIWDF